MKCAETEVLLWDKYIGSIDRFRYKAGWRFTDEIVIKFDEKSAESGEIDGFSQHDTLGALPHLRCQRVNTRRMGCNLTALRTLPSGGQLGAGLILPTPTPWWRTRQYSQPTMDRFSRFQAMPLMKAAR